MTESCIETPRVFACAGEQLLGIHCAPVLDARDIAVLIVVGGPQYRAGSHRQFTLLARALAGAGFASLRFDYRGMGDSDGEFRNFEAVDIDLRAATDELLHHASGCRGVVIWGLCDAASAALYYAPTDSRVLGNLRIENFAARRRQSLRIRDPRNGRCLIQNNRRRHHRPRQGAATRFVHPGYDHPRNRG